MNDQEKVRLHAIVEGGVQGVGFRMFVQDQGVRLGLVGWVRNRWDGSVEVVAEGERGQVEKLLTALYQGPRAAYVTGVSPTWLPAREEFSSFQARMTSG